MRPLLLATTLFGLVWTISGAAAPKAGATGDRTLLVSAAASLTEAMKEIGMEYSRSHPGLKVQFNFAASGALQKQIEQGAPADVFASASPKEMDALQARGLLAPSTRRDFAMNRLVLITPRSSKVTGWGDLATAKVAHFAMSDPAFVPSGRYARQTLERRKLWSAVKPKAVFGENVRQTLSYVANGNAEAGIVFASDVSIERERIKVIASPIPGKDHDPVLYPAAALRDAPNPSEARAFVSSLAGDAARKILKRYSFTAPAGVRVVSRAGRPSGAVLRSGAGVPTREKPARSGPGVPARGAPKRR